jgi:hypothetical protein
MLNLMLDHPKLMEFNGHKISDYNETLEECILHEDDQRPYSDKERMEIARMNVKLMDMKG